MSSPSVEVKCLDTFAYYPAFLRDYDNASQVMVSYPGGWKKDEWVLLENVRNAAGEFDAAAFHPVQGDTIEAQAKSSDEEPYSWWKATVKTVRGEFYMISYSSWEDEFNEILEKDMLRPLNKNPSLKPADLKKLELPLPRDLQHSGSLDTRALNGVLETSGALSVHIDTKKQTLVILGNAVSVKRAQLLAGMAFKHLGEIQRLTERKLKHQSQLDSLKQRLNEGHLETFSINPPALMGLVIGTRGDNIRRVEKLPGVLNVRVDSSKHQVSILAKSEEEAKAAREQLEFVEQRFPILQRQAGRVVGKSFSNMAQIQRDSGVVKIRLVDMNQNDPATAADPEATVDLIIIGTKENVADALLLLNHHMEFLNTVNQLSGEERELNDEVRKLNIEAGNFEEEQQQQRTYGAGRGGFGGRGRGPRPNGNRQYSSAQADFPPLPATARAPKPAAAPAAVAASATSAPVASDSDDRKESASTGRGGRGGRGRGPRADGDRQPRAPRQPRQPKQEQATAPAAVPVAAAASDATAAAGTTAAPSQPKKERKPKQPRAPKAEKVEVKVEPGVDASANGAAAATAAVDGAGTPSPPAAGAADAKPKRDQRRNQRRPRQPASAPPAAPAAPAATTTTQ